MKKKYFSGDSVRQAVLQAARYFELDPEALAYREVDRRHGFLRGRRRAVIEVDQENPLRPPGEAEAPPATEPAVAAPPAVDRPPLPRQEERERETPADDPPVREMPAEAPPEPVDSPDPVEPVKLVEPAGRPQDAWGSVATTDEPEPVAKPESTPAAAAGSADSVAAADSEAPFEKLSDEPGPPARRYPQADGDLAEAAQEALGRLFELGQLDLSAEVLQGEERLEVELSGADEDFLLEDRGRLLLAIQHLLPRMLRGLTGKSAPCWVDCDNFHEIRTEQLRDLAQRIASEVRNSRRSQTLEPMSPDERRIVHLTLTDDTAVETVSQGNGLFKRVQVRPLRDRPRGFDPSN